MSWPPDPVAFTLGPLAVRWYGLCSAAGFLAAMVHWMRLARRDGRPSSFGADFGVLVALTGVVGGRLTFVIAHADRFLAQPSALLRFDRGGLVYLGGFALAVLAAILWGRRRGVGPAAVLDFGVTGVTLAHAIGRIGCLFNGCCHGIRAAAPWGIPAGGGCFVPVQAYEAAFNLTLYVVLNRAYGRHRPGAVFGLYLLLYGAWRFAVEFARGDARMIWGPLHAAQWICLGLVAGGALLWLGRRGSARS